eukprot:JP441176.1.p2 GENE.JP441176.1~~JP441176.1.p2  ORF type:complete len:61 (+),score=7.38 JP441176.1:1-183(+)
MGVSDSKPSCHSSGSGSSGIPSQSNVKDLTIKSLSRWSKGSFDASDYDSHDPGNLYNPPY